MTAGIVLAVIIFTPLTCLAESDEVKTVKKAKGNYDDAKTLATEGLGKAGDTKGLVNKKVTGKLQGWFADVLYAVWGGGAGPIMSSEQGQEKTLKFMETVTGKNPSGGVTLRQATEDNVTPQAPPNDNYYDDPRLDPREREQLLNLERRMKNDPDVADNCKNQIRHILSGSGIRSPYDVVQQNVSPAAPQTATVERFDGTYSGSYGGDASGAVTFTIAQGAISIRSPGRGSGAVNASGSASFAGAGTDAGGASYTFLGTFLVGPGGGASANGKWSAKSTFGPASGSWTASRR